MSLEIAFPDVNFRPLPTPVEPEPPYVGLDHQPIVWDDRISFGQAYQNYEAIIRSLREKLGIRLPLKDIYLHFMSQTQLKVLLDKKSHEERYGAYIINEVVGLNTKNQDGTTTLRIAHQGIDHIANFRDTMRVIGHEYGHNIGYTLPDPLREEMKAFTFESLFMEEDFGHEARSLYGVYPDKLHDVARNNVNQLLERGFPQGAIIARLTGLQFGRYNPAEIPFGHFT